MKLDFIFHKVSSSLVQYNKKKEIGNLAHRIMTRRHVPNLLIQRLEAWESDSTDKYLGNGYPFSCKHPDSHLAVKSNKIYQQNIKMSLKYYFNQIPVQQVFQIHRYSLINQ